MALSRNASWFGSLREVSFSGTANPQLKISPDGYIIMLFIPYLNHIILLRILHNGQR
jgi:hypothetical protein